MSFLEYQEHPATRAMRGLPRFGKPSNFAYVFSPDSKQTSDYIYGLLFAGIFILAAFIAWLVMLFAFKCLGKRKVGFLSGSAMEAREGSSKPFIVRSVFVLATLLLVAFSVLIVTQGLTNVYTTYDTLRQSTKDVDKIIQEADAASDSLSRIGQSAVAIRDVLVQAIGTDFCSAVSDLGALTGIDFNATTDEVKTFLNDLDNFFAEDIANVQDSVSTAASTSSDVRHATENIEIDDWQSLMIIIPFVTFSFFLIVGVILAWMDKDIPRYQCFLSWFILPLFVIFIVVCYVLAAAIAIVASANADFCSGGQSHTPDETLIDAMQLNGFTQADLVYRVVIFYIDKCTERNPLAFFLQYEEKLAMARSALEEFELEIDNTTRATLQGLCNENFTPLVTLINSLKADVRLLLDLAITIMGILACNRLVPIYTSTFYTGTCAYSIKGVTWTFSAFLVISLVGMVIIMLRSSWLPCVNVEGKYFEESAAMEAVEVEYEPHHGERPVEGGEEEYETDDDKAPDGDAPGIIGDVAAGAAVGAIATSAESAPEEGGGAVESNEFDPENDDNWLGWEA